MNERIDRRKFLIGLGTLAGGALACNLSVTTNNEEPTLKPVSPVPTIEKSPTPTSTETLPEVIDPFTKAIDELFKNLSYDPKTGLYEKNGKHYKFVNSEAKGCPGQINFSLIEVSNECPTSTKKPVQKVTKRPPERPTQSQPGETPQRPPETPVHKVTENPTSTAQKPEPTNPPAPLPAGTPVPVATMANTPAPVIVVPPTVNSAPVSTPGI